MFLAALMLVSIFSVGAVDTISAEAQSGIYMPLWMQPDTVIVYDASMNYTIVQGGELTEEDLIGREDIAAVGLTSKEPGMLAEPNTKVDYDHHGFIRNIHYPSPGRPGEYQLSNPRGSRLGSGIIPINTKYYYGNYLNYDNGVKMDNLLYRYGDPINQMNGWGQITYFTDTMGDNNNKLKLLDCATKQGYDDVQFDTPVYVTNTYANKSKTFYKNDVGGLPRAILDVWASSTSNPITSITTNGKVDNVYTAHMYHNTPEVKP